MEKPIRITSLPYSPVLLRLLYGFFLNLFLLYLN